MEAMTQTQIDRVKINKLPGCDSFIITRGASVLSDKPAQLQAGIHKMAGPSLTWQIQAKVQA
jgi:hypothetical protein